MSGELATRFVTRFVPDEVPPPTPPPSLGEPLQLRLAVSSPPVLRRCPLIILSDSVTLLREFLLDEAFGSLVADLRQCGMAKDVALSRLCQGRHFG